MVAFCPLYLDATDQANLSILLFETIYNIGRIVSCGTELSNWIMFLFKPVISFGDLFFFYCEEW